MRKLTKAQAHIVSLLIDDPDLIIMPTSYGAHQASMIDPTGKHNEFGSTYVQSFYQSTFEILIATGMFTEIKKGQFKLTQNIKP